MGLLRASMISSPIMPIITGRFWEEKHGIWVQCHYVTKTLKIKPKGGKEASIDEHECLKWLDTKKPNSIVYICFGTIAKLSDSQLIKIAMGLKASG